VRKTFWLPLTLALGAFLLLPMPGLSESLNGRIQHQRNKIAQKLHHEGVLTTTISTFNNRIDGLQGSIRSLQAREERIQTTLDQKRAELAAIQNKLQVATAWRVCARDSPSPRSSLPRASWTSTSRTSPTSSP
jgi:peptidoglycan hydrolase CwlO-like protein